MRKLISSVWEKLIRFSQTVSLASVPVGVAWLAMSAGVLGGVLLGYSYQTERIHHILDVTQKQVKNSEDTYKERQRLQSLLLNEYIARNDALSAKLHELEKKELKARDEKTKAATRSIVDSIISSVPGTSPGKTTWK